MQISFILVGSESEENIGAAARALKTMGFDRLILVDPAVSPGRISRYVAHGSTDILEKMQICSTLTEALADTDYAVATTRPGRRLRKTPVEGQQLFRHLQERRAAVRHVALVFGRESRGMTNAELELCDALSFLPQASPTPALNLGQCVMLYAWLLRQGMTTTPDESQASSDPVADGPEPQYRHLRDGVDRLLPGLGIPADGSTRQKIHGRLAMLSYEDMRLMQNLVQRLTRALNDPPPAP